MDFYLILFLENILPFVNYAYSYYTLAIVLFILQIILILLYLIDFRLLSSHLILFFFIGMLFIYFLFVYDNMILDNIVCNVGDNNQIGTNVNLEGHVHVNDKEAGKSLANHVGIIGGMGVVGGLVGKAVAKAPMPPLAKAGLVVGGAIVGGVVEKVINNSGNIGASSTFSVNNGTISKLVNDSQVSVLQENFFLQEVFYSVVLYMVLLIVIQLIFKLYFKDNVKLNLSKLLGVNFNNKVEYYLNKIILLNKKMSIFWTWFGIMVIIYGISRFTYAIYLMRTKLDSAINAHLSLHPLKDNLHITDRSLEEVLFYLQWGNFICLVTLINLTVILLYKFHLNKEISTVYIWVLILILIIILVYSVYISSELYTNLDNYVYTYSNTNN